MEYINNNSKEWSVRRFEILPSISILRGFGMIQICISWLHEAVLFTIKK